MQHRRNAQHRESRHAAGFVDGQAHALSQHLGLAAKQLLCTLCKGLRILLHSSCVVQQSPLDASITAAFNGWQSSCTERACTKRVCTKQRAVTQLAERAKREIAAAADRAELPQYRPAKDASC